MTRPNLFRCAATLFACIALLAACGLFPAKYDATTVELMTRMKAYHLKFVDDFMTATPRPVDDVKAACNEGDLRFRETIEYARAISGGDQTRENALNILKGQFEDDCNRLMTDQAPSPGFVAEIRAEIAQNYDVAIAGERSRPGAD